MGVVFERLGDQTGKVDRAQQAGAIGRQRLLATGVGGGNGLAIVQVVGGIDAVDKDHARLGVVIGRLHDLVPQVPRLHGLIDLAAENEVPRAVGLHSLHEGVGDQHGHVEHAQTRGVGFGGDEILHIRVVAAHGRHHRAPARACGHDSAAHRVPDIHEGQRARGIRRDAQHIRAAWPNGGEIIADSPALLHGECGFFQHIKDAGHAVGHGAHDEAVEQRHAARGARACGDAASGEVFEILQRVEKLVFPNIRLRFDLREVARDAAPCVLYRDVLGGAIGPFKTVFHIPDLFGDRGGKAGHGETPEVD